MFCEARSNVGTVVGEGGAIKKLRAMETLKTQKNHLPIMLVSLQQQC